MVDLGEIQTKVLSSQLPDTFTGIVQSIDEASTREGGKSIKLNVEIVQPKAIMVGDKEVTVKGDVTVIMFRVAKALTGRGQTDLLLHYMRQLGFTDTANLVGNKYQWKRTSLSELSKLTGASIPASFNENPRHYPVKLIV